MAQRIVRVDDIDQKTEGAVATTFAVDGTTYDIDLGEANLSVLRESLAPFVEAGRPRPKATGSSKKTTIDKVQLDAIRRWAHAHGYEFSDRGRIPGHIVEAYEKLAHPSKREAAEKTLSEAGAGPRGLFSEAQK